MPDPIKTMSLRAIVLLVLTVAAFALVLFGADHLGRFALNVLTRSMIWGVLAITVDLLWGFTGILTFGQAAFFGVGAYATAILLGYFGDGSGAFVVSGLAAIVLPAALGLLVGWLSFYYGSTPLYATVISLVFPIVVTQLVFSGGELTGSSSGLVGYATLPLSLKGYFRLAGAALVIAAVTALIFVRSDAGRILVAIRDNETRLAYLGLNTQKIRIVLLAVLAGVAGLAGFLFANASGVVAPENTGFVFGTELVVWTALGGRGTVLGAVLGTVGVDYLSANLSGDLPFLWQLIVGLIFVVMIIVMPNGLAGLIGLALRRLNVGRSGSAPKIVPIPASAVGPVKNGNALIEIAGLAKSYGSQKVLSAIDLKVGAGELVSLVGPNGAGKTTLMRCISDGTEEVSGSIAIAGAPIAGLTPDLIVTLGVGRKFQVASVFESLTVAECLRLARSRHERPSPLRTVSTIRLPAAACDILRLTGLDGELATPVSLLSHGQKQSLELVMVVSLEPRVILLDEPTAGLTKAERTTIGAVLKHLTADLGYAAILVEHDLDFVRDISSRIVVLHQGRLVLDGDVEEVVSSPIVSEIYAGAAHA